MKLYSFHPDALSVARHFQSMARGELKDQMRRQVGYGRVGSKLKIGNGTVMRRRPLEDEKTAVLQQVTPVEVGLQQANAELAARRVSKKKGGVVKRKQKGKIKSSAKSLSSHSGARKERGKAKAEKKKKKPRAKKAKRSDNFS